MLHAQKAQGIDDDTYTSAEEEEDVRDILDGIIDEEEDDPGALDCSDDEAEVVTPQMAERARRAKENKKEFDKCMMRPRSRQSAALNVRPELEGRVMSMLVGENSDWVGSPRSFEEGLKPNDAVA